MLLLGVLSLVKPQLTVDETFELKVPTSVSREKSVLGYGRRQVSFSQTHSVPVLQEILLTFVPPILGPSKVPKLTTFR